MKRTLRFNLLIGLIAILTVTSCTKNEVTSVTLNNTQLNILLAQTDSLIVTVTGTGDMKKFPITWSTSNSGIATVKNGSVKGISTGVATITAKSGNVTASCDVIVDNQIAPSFNKGILLYYGDTLHTSTSNMYIMGLADSKDTIYLFVNTALSAKNNLPAGNYSLLTQMKSEKDFVPFSITPGYIYNGYDEFSWHYGAIKSAIQGGSIILSVSNSIYAVKYNLADSYGNSIIGTYNGTLNFKDLTKKSSAPAEIKGWSKVNQLKMTSTLLKFNN